MRRLALCLLFLAQAAGVRAADVTSAEANLRRVEALVQAGAASRSTLEEARRQLQDARNEQLLRRTLYSGNVTPQDVPEMLRAASELKDRAAEALTARQKMAAEGVLPAKELERWQQEAGYAERQWEMAQTRANLVEELAEMARREAELAEEEKRQLALRSTGSGTLTEQDFQKVESAFYYQYAHTLPVSARGSTPVHRSLGFDHRDRFDVSLNPDQEEGRWLINLLDRLRVPYIAFRRAVAGRATGAHIHIGLPSPRE
ncbi:MAG: hypothetical protein HY236_11785 [Acidobacteria bacterium]|nr:hypothetical protein [Acidobacteriota bacterium]